MLKLNWKVSEYVAFVEKQKQSARKVPVADMNATVLESLRMSGSF